jgi:hypothetical protein
MFARTSRKPMRPSSLSFTSEPTLQALAGHCVWRPWLGSPGIQVRDAFAGGPRGASRRPTTSGDPGWPGKTAPPEPGFGRGGTPGGAATGDAPLTYRETFRQRRRRLRKARRRDRRLARSRWYNSEASKRCSRWRGSGSVPVARQTEVVKAHGQQTERKVVSSLKQTFLLTRGGGWRWCLR